MDSPILGIVVGNGKLSGYENIVEEDLLAHCPQLKPDSCDGTEPVVRSVFLEVGGVFNLTGSPFSLHKHTRTLLILDIDKWSGECRMGNIMRFLTDVIHTNVSVVFEP